jgi:hypothetical protein
MVGLTSLAFSTPALAAPCGDFAAIVAGLAEHYGEVPQEIGNTEKTMTVAFVNPTTRTFTIVVASTNGSACLVAAGEHWREAEKGKPS